MLIDIGDLFHLEHPATWLEHYVTFERLFRQPGIALDIENGVRKKFTMNHPRTKNIRFSVDFILVEIFNKYPQIR